MTDATTSEGVAIKISDGGSPEAFTTIAEITSFDGPDGDVDIYDVTNFDSAQKEKIAGLLDEGTVTLGMNFLPGHTQHTQLRTNRAAKTLTQFQVALNDSGSTTITFFAYIRSISPSGSVGSQLTANVQLEITGTVVWA